MPLNFKAQHQKHMIGFHIDYQKLLVSSGETNHTSSIPADPMVFSQIINEGQHQVYEYCA